MVPKQSRSHTVDGAKQQVRDIVAGWLLGETVRIDGLVKIVRSRVEQHGTSNKSSDLFNLAKLAESKHVFIRPFHYPLENLIIPVSIGHNVMA